MKTILLLLVCATLLLPARAADAPWPDLPKTTAEWSVRLEDFFHRHEDILVAVLTDDEKKLFQTLMSDQPEMAKELVDELVSLTAIVSPGRIDRVSFSWAGMILENNVGAQADGKIMSYLATDSLTPHQRQVLGELHEIFSGKFNYKGSGESVWYPDLRELAGTSGSSPVVAHWFSRTTDLNALPAAKSTMPRPTAPPRSPATSTLGSSTAPAPSEPPSPALKWLLLAAVTLAVLAVVVRLLRRK